MRADLRKMLNGLLDISASSAESSALFQARSRRWTFDVSVYPVYPLIPSTTGTSAAEFSVAAVLPVPIKTPSRNNRCAVPLFDPIYTAGILLTIPEAARNSNAASYPDSVKYPNVGVYPFEFAIRYVCGLPAQSDTRAARPPVGETAENDSSVHAPSAADGSAGKYVPSAENLVPFPLDVATMPAALFVVGLTPPRAKSRAYPSPQSEANWIPRVIGLLQSNSTVPVGFRLHRLGRIIVLTA